MEEQRPPRRPGRRGSRGGSGAPGRRRCGTPGAGPGLRSPAGQLRARPRREAQPEPSPWAGEAASRAERAGGGGRRAEAAGPGRHAPSLAAPYLAAPPPLARVASSPPPRAAPARAPSAEPSPAGPRPCAFVAGPGGPRPLGARGPSPGAGGFRTSPTAARALAALSPKAERRAGLRRASRPLGTPPVRKRGQPESGLRAPGAPSGAGPFLARPRPRAGLRPFRTGLSGPRTDGAEPGECRARAEGIPPTLARALGPPRRSLRRPANEPPARQTLASPPAVRPGLGELFPAPFPGARRPRPLPPPRCLPGWL